MAHKEQTEFCLGVKVLFPDAFCNARVLDIGAFDVNGTERDLFTDCEFIGLDIAPGDGVDVVCPAQDYDEPDESFDTIISCECWEHNPFYAESILNAIRMLKSGGLFLFTCATTGRAVHGTKSVNEEQKSIALSLGRAWKTMPNVFAKDWDNEYYLNLTEEDIRDVVDIDKTFSIYAFQVEETHHDLYFWGIKR